MKTSAMSPALARVAAADTCAGCGLCASLGGEAISMAVDRSGYRRPVQHAPISATIDGVIADTCPGLVEAPWSDRPRHPFWGPYRETMTGHAADDANRRRASSGGLISALLAHALESGWVSAVLHVTADPDRPTRNLMTISRSAAEIWAASGSRYAPSSPLEDIEALLAGTDVWAIVAKPCDASALRRLALRDARVDQRIPLILSFFCGGVPSHAGAERILDSLRVANDDLRAFRYRGDGWPGYATATRIDGSTERMSYMDSWGRHLSPTMQYRCKICPDAVGGVADLACGDAWHCDARGYPLFEEDDGRSLMLTRTEAGSRLVASAVASGVIRVAPLPVEDIDAMQPGQVRRKSVLLARMAGAVLAGQRSFRPRDVAIVAAARRAKTIDFARNFIGTFRRVLRRSRSDTGGQR